MTIILTYIVGFSLLFLSAAPFLAFVATHLRGFSRGQTVIAAALFVYLVQHIGWISLQSLNILHYNSWMLVTVLLTVLAAGGFALFRSVRLPAYRTAFCGLWRDARGLVKQAPRVTILLAILLALIFARMAAFPEGMADALSYHIMKAVMPLALPGWPAPVLQEYLLQDAVRAYPGFANMLSAWWMGLPFGGMDNNEGGNFTTYLLGFVALYTLSRRIGSDVTGGLLAGLVYLITPCVLNLGISGYVDLTASVMALCALCFVGQRGTVRERMIAAVIIGIGLGLAIASRYSMLSVMGLVGVGALGALIYQSWGHLRGSWTMIAAQVLVIGSIALLTGFPQYLYNWLHFTNPLAPHGLSIGPFHFEGYYAPERNAFGAYYGFIEPDFAAKPEWLQLWLNWMDTANITWKASLWNGYVHPTWGNALSWVVLPAVISVIAFSTQRLYMMALCVLAFGYLLTIPYALPACRFHLWAALILYPAVGLLWQMAKQHRKAAGLFLTYLTLAFVTPQALMIVPSSIADHIIDLAQHPELGDWRAVNAEDKVQLATHDRPPGWSIDVGPEGVKYFAFYTYRRSTPFAEPVWWEMRTPFDQSVAYQGSKDPGLLVLCGNRQWCPDLSASPDYVLLSQGAERSLYATKASFTTAGAP